MPHMGNCLDLIMPGLFSLSCRPDLDIDTEAFAQGAISGEWGEFTPER